MNVADRPTDRIDDSSQAIAKLPPSVRPSVRVPWRKSANLAPRSRDWDTARRGKVLRTLTERQRPDHRRISSHCHGRQAGGRAGGHDGGGGECERHVWPAAASAVAAVDA